MHVTRSKLDSLIAPDAFQWMAGIEDTFITAPSVKTGRTLDEYQLTEHYERWRTTGTPDPARPIRPLRRHAPASPAASTPAAPAPSPEGDGTPP